MKITRPGFRIFNIFQLTGLVSLSALLFAQAASAENLTKDCEEDGWKVETLKVGVQKRKVIWKSPGDTWKQGAIVVMHGGGGDAAHFCAGGWLVRPQIKFAQEALKRGFAVFSLDSTNDVVTDEKGRECGKRFDFSVLDRPNLDLPFIESVITDLVPKVRPKTASAGIYMTGLSSGGYMTTRAAASMPGKVTAFAPVSAGDPFGTDTDCDISLSKRTSAKGILKDRDTGKQIIEVGACATEIQKNENPWPKIRNAKKPTVKQFHHQQDGIVDLSCLQRAHAQLKLNGFPVQDVFLIEKSRRRNALNHLWQTEYNEPILDFFESQRP